MRGHQSHSEEDFLWPEDRSIRGFALVRSYMMTAVNLVGTLALLWATVVLLGGFVTALKRKDFWYLTIISFMQAAGLFTVGADDNYLYFIKWWITFYTKLVDYFRKKDKKLAEAYTPPTRDEFVNMMGSAVSSPVIIFVSCAPIVCSALSVVRLRQRDYSSDDGDTSKANLKPALDLFYSLSLAQGAIILLMRIFVSTAHFYVLAFIGRHGLSREVILGYRDETFLRCVKSRASTKSWNLIIYGAGLLDSELPEDYVSGARTLNMLIEHKILVKWQLIHSPRHRIQKLIGSLSWRSPAEREIRWLAARILGHIASDLKLAQFPGALECISSLLDTPGHDNNDEEAVCMPIEHKQKRRRKIAQNRWILKQNEKRSLLARVYWDLYNCFVNKIELEGSDNDLIVQGLIIMENLTHDKHNCTQINNSKSMLSKVTAPVRTDNLIEDIRMNNVAWIKVLGASLRVVIRLIVAQHEIVGNSKAVENLMRILNEKGDSNILELQMGAIGVLSKLFSDESINMCTKRRYTFIERMLGIFVDDKWIENYLNGRKEKVIEETVIEAMVEERMQEARKKASQLKVKAGEALAILSKGSQSNSDVIMIFNESRRIVHCLTEMLDSKINVGCRISAARILKHLCAHSTVHIDKGRIQTKVLEKLFAIYERTESQAQDGVERNSSPGTLKDIENQLSAGDYPHELSTTPKPQQSERVLQAALLSLYATICHIWTSEDGFTDVFSSLVARDDFEGKLKAIIEESSYVTPACLAILKNTCQMIILLMQNGKGLKEINGEEIVDKLSEASEAMAELESSMLFAGVDHDCYGVPVKPLFSVLVKKARELIEKEQ